jgi:hypothetical protein
MINVSLRHLSHGPVQYDRPMLLQQQNIANDKITLTPSLQWHVAWPGRPKGNCYSLDWMKISRFVRCIHVGFLLILFSLVGMIV